MILVSSFNSYWCTGCKVSAALKIQEGYKVGYALSSCFMSMLCSVPLFLRSPTLSPFRAPRKQIWKASRWALTNDWHHSGYIWEKLAKDTKASEQWCNQEQPDIPMFPIFLSCNITVYKYLLNYVQINLEQWGSPCSGQLHTLGVWPDQSPSTFCPPPLLMLATFPTLARGNNAVCVVINSQILINLAEVLARV